ncbi:MAG: pseudouridine synthase, partial [Chloroflexi bacterium]|nr:pseudouridine synthase [Chloroflexota bacterium]
MEERLQKIMAQAGLGSRRDCEEFIIAGRVRVNGQLAVIGQKADTASDTVTLDGRIIKPAEQKVYVALHKPRYVLSTVDAEQGDSRQTVRDLVPVSERLYPVGRLDFESEGLVLMTNDGELAQKLTHPSHGHSKEYRVLLARQPDTEQLATWQRGVVLEDGYKTQRTEIRIESLAGKGAWVRIVMREGRKRQIREIGAILALPVVRIVRIRIGNLLLGELKPSEWRYLTPVEIKALKEDRPGLAPFPNMTRKSPEKSHSKPVRRAPGRTGPPSGKEKSQGRTPPPDGSGRAPVRRGPPSDNEKASGRTSPSDGSGRAPVRRGPPSANGKAPGRTSPPGGTGRAPVRRGPSSDNENSAGRSSPSDGTGRAPIRRGPPSGSGK